MPLLAADEEDMAFAADAFEPASALFVGAGFDAPPGTAATGVFLSLPPPMMRTVFPRGLSSFFAVVGAGLAPIVRTFGAAGVVLTVVSGTTDPPGVGLAAA